MTHCSSLLSFFIAFVSVGALACPAVNGRQDVGVDTRRIDADFAAGNVGKAIDAELAKLNADRFSGCMLVAVEGRVVVAKSVGAFGGDNKSTLKPNALFEIASATKAFTSTAALILAEQGKLDLDASIGDYLPEVPESSRKITVRNLMSHQSGVPGTQYGVNNEGLDRAVVTMLVDGPRNEPGTKFEYWNQGYILLSQIVARASGKSFEDFVRESIFVPCEMEGSCFLGDTVPEGFVATTGTGKIGPPRSCLEHPYGGTYLAYAGTGGIVSNVLDMWKFHQALHSGKLLNEDSMRQAIDHGEFPYGLGWFVESFGSDSKISHGGAVRGYKCDFRRYPALNGSIVVLCNRDDVQPNLVADRIEAMLFADKKIDGLSNEEIAALTGVYESKEGRRLIIETRDGRATYTVLWAPNQPNGPVSRGYVRRNDKGKIEFQQSNETSVMDVKFPAMGEPVSKIAYAEIDLSFKRVADNDAARLMANQQAKMPNPLPADDVAKWLGKYRSDTGAVLEITSEQGHTIFVLDWRPGQQSPPKTMGYVMQRDDGSLVLYHPREAIDIKIELSDDKSQVTKIGDTQDKLTFDRE